MCRRIFCLLCILVSCLWAQESGWRVGAGVSRRRFHSPHYHVSSPLKGETVIWRRYYYEPVYHIMDGDGGKAVMDGDEGKETLATETEAWIPERPWEPYYPPWRPVPYPEPVPVVVEEEAMTPGSRGDYSREETTSLVLSAARTIWERRWTTDAMRLNLTGHFQYHHLDARSGEGAYWIYAIGYVLSPRYAMPGWDAPAEGQIAQEGGARSDTAVDAPFNTDIFYPRGYESWSFIASDMTLYTLDFGCEWEYCLHDLCGVRLSAGPTVTIGDIRSEYTAVLDGRYCHRKADNLDVELGYYCSAALFWQWNSRLGFSLEWRRDFAGPVRSRFVKQDLATTSTLLQATWNF